jgi:segregation and condensation protein A
VSDADQTELDLAAAEEAEGREALLVALDAFEGPLHLLLELTRARKVDATKVSIGELADQYLASSPKRTPRIWRSRATIW